MEQWALGHFNEDTEFKSAVSNMVNQRHVEILRTLFDVDALDFKEEE